MYLITIDADVSGGKKGINVDTGAGEQRDVGGEERDVGAGEQRDVGGGEEEKVGNPNNEDDNDEWFTDFSSMRKEVEVETDDHHSEELKNLISSDDEYEDVDKVYPRYNESSRVGE